MPEVKRKVVPFEVNYVCDKCKHGMMTKTGETDRITGDTEHQCVICGHKQVFKWVSYPRIDYVAEDDLGSKKS